MGLLLFRDSSDKIPVNGPFLHWIACLYRTILPNRTLCYIKILSTTLSSKISNIGDPWPVVEVIYFNTLSFPRLNSVLNFSNSVSKPNIQDPVISLHASNCTLGVPYQHDLCRGDLDTRQQLIHQPSQYQQASHLDPRCRG